MLAQNKRVVLEQVSYSINGHSILNTINLDIKKGESLAVIGNSGSGKTTLANLLVGKKALTDGKLVNNLKSVLVPQQDEFSELAGFGSNYYSKRYEFHEYEKQLTVDSLLKNKVEAEELNSLALKSIFKTLEIDSLRPKNLLSLSNGERKRLQIALALLQKPEFLILDQPFVGLDVSFRKKLTRYLQELQQDGISIFIICSANEIPPFVTNIVVLERGKLSAFNASEENKNRRTTFNASLEVDSLLENTSENYKTIVEMKRVNVAMKGKPILSDINWIIKPGENWALLGHNGAGKSTLLSLITADNPQGYNNHLVLFDKQRGSGESIWDIKQKIGYLSPELHLYFMRGKGVRHTVPGITSQAGNYSKLTFLDVLISGYQDEIGTVSKATKHQEEIALKWLKMVRLDSMQNALFVHASLGEQRVLLLLRALIKNPPLLILDEPCQGMDTDQISYFKSLLNHICETDKVTLVYVSHKKEEIPNCVNKILTLENGNVV
ncbi:ATP-binding cassette domain-containing protein [Galbibacter sp. BG1]|uniref:ATP-binding cassette domain-containing protein n=1 Tax=Galbibacter sp. BG1 TaxID=1170699 RepID=UPI0015B85A96|nr:ATP-binding cassette domain-containing protein [Galbibacter sp. BG1]QLE02282.1 ATP-binding cassette domain-containing protein [Galbibacter sp. BG1]